MSKIDTRVLIKILENAFHETGEFSVKNQRFFFRAKEDVIKSLRNSENYWPRESTWLKNKTTFEYVPGDCLPSAEKANIRELKSCYPNINDAVRSFSQCFRLLFDCMWTACGENRENALKYISVAFSEYQVNDSYFDYIQRLDWYDVIEYLIDCAREHKTAPEDSSLLPPEPSDNSMSYLVQQISGHIKRDALLKQLHDILASGKIGIISEGPSAGKTSLAISFAQTFRSEYIDNKIIFLNCETLTDIYNSLGITSESIVQSNTDKLSFHKNQIMNTLKRQLPHYGKALLIFDNIGYDHDTKHQKRIIGFEDFMIDIINELHDLGESKPDILVTTRLSETRFKYGEHLLFKGFDSGELRTYFEKQTCLPVTDDDINYILKSFGSHSTDGNYYILPGIANLTKDVAIMKNSFRAVKDIHLNEESPSSLTALFSTIFEYLGNGTNHEQIFKTTLEITAFLDTEQIPQDLLYHILRRLYPQISSDTVNAVLAEYCPRLSILKKNDKQYSIHRSYHSCIYRLISDSKKQEYIEVLISVFHEYIKDYAYYDYHQWLTFKQYYSHMSALTTRMEPDDFAIHPPLIVQMAWYAGYVCSNFAAFHHYNTIINDLDIPVYLKGMMLCDKILISLKLGMRNSDLKDDLSTIEDALNDLTFYNDWEIDMLDIRYHVAYSEYQLDCKEYKNSLDYAKKGIDLCKQAHSAFQQKELLSFFSEHTYMLNVQCGRAYRIGYGNYKLAIETLEQTLADIQRVSQNRLLPASEREHYKMIHAQILNDLAVCHYESESDSTNYDMALDYYQQSYSIFKEINYYYGMAREYKNIANLYRSMALNELDTHSDQATDLFYTYIDNFKEYLESSYTIRNENTVLDTSFLKDYYSYYYLLSIVESKNNQLTDLEKIQKLDEGIHALQKAQNVITGTELVRDACTFKRYEGIHYRKSGQLLKDTDEQQKAYQKAVTCFEEAIETAQSNGLMRPYYFATIELALVYALATNQQSCSATLSAIEEDMFALKESDSFLYSRFNYIKEYCEKLVSYRRRSI